MKILIYSPYFYPKLGGVEVKTMGLAEMFTKKGNDVCVVTNTINSEIDTFPYKVIRKPGVLEYLRLFNWCDVYMQMNVSLRGVFPFIFFRKYFFLSHENTYYKADGSINLNGRIKYFITGLCHFNFCCSNYVAQFIKKDFLVVGSPYREDIFSNIIPFEKRQLDIVFLGRLVSDKGCKFLLEALHMLHLDNYKLNLSIIGDGPEKSNLIQLTEKYGLNRFVKFHGSVVGENLKILLNNYKIMVVPSIWQEPFGIVALEGLACGCKLIVSDGGGLNEAIGNYGHTFQSGNIDSLIERIQMIFNNSNGGNLPSPEEHLKEYSLETISKKYLKVFNSYFS